MFKRKLNKKAALALSLGLMAVNSVAYAGGNTVFDKLSDQSIANVKNKITTEAPVAEGDGNNVSIATSTQTGMGYSVPAEVSGYTALNQATKDSACTTGQIAMDSSGKILSCQSNTWKASGGSDDAMLGSEGQTTLPSGLIIKWGNRYAGGNRSSCHNFPISFPHSLTSVQATPASGQGSGGGKYDYWGTYGLSVSGFCISNAYDGAKRFTYIALGY